MSPNIQNSTLIAPKFNEFTLETQDIYNQKRENFGQNYRNDQRFGNNQGGFTRQGPNNYNNNMKQQKYKKHGFPDNKSRTFEEKVFRIFITLVLKY